MFWPWKCLSSQLWWAFLGRKILEIAMGDYGQEFGQNGIACQDNSGVHFLETNFEWQALWWRRKCVSRQLRWESSASPTCSSSVSRLSGWLHIFFLNFCSSYFLKHKTTAPPLCPDSQVGCGTNGNYKNCCFCTGIFSSSQFDFEFVLL